MASYSITDNNGWTMGRAETKASALRKLLRLDLPMWLQHDGDVARYGTVEQIKAELATLDKRRADQTRRRIGLAA